MRQNSGKVHFMLRYQKKKAVIVIIKTVIFDRDLKLVVSLNINLALTVTPQPDLIPTLWQGVGSITRRGGQGQRHQLLRAFLSLTNKKGTFDV